MARAFNGSNQSVVFKHDTALALGSGDVSVACWLWLASGHIAYMCLFEKAGTGGGRDLAVFFPNSAAGTIFVSVGQSDAEFGTSLSAWPKDQWFHFGFARASGSTAVYCNGVSVATQAIGGTSTTTNDLSIGLDASGTLDLTGRVAEFAVFGSRALTATEFAVLSDNRDSPARFRGTNGVLYAPMLGDSFEPDIWGGRPGIVSGAVKVDHPLMIPGRYVDRRRRIVASAAAPAGVFAPYYYREHIARAG